MSKRIIITALVIFCLFSLWALKAPTFSSSADSSSTSGSTSNISIRLSEKVSGLTMPLYFTEANDDSGRFFIVEKGGQIKILKNGTLLDRPFLDLTTRVSKGTEQGLLGFALHPRFAANSRLFVHFTDLNGDSRVLEFRQSETETDVVEQTSEKLILSVDQPYDNHNGGGLEFGPDGFLYIGLGDGGAAGDPHGNGQNLGTLLGKILRINVDSGDPYNIPNGNPFQNQPNQAKAEIWAYGLRNPWRYSFDTTSGRLFAGDVGQNSLEEIDIIEAGKNYGWNPMEGSNCFISRCQKSLYALPISDYGRDEGFSVTGGYVYRGKKFPDLFGKYLFADFVSGTIWTLTEKQDGTWNRDVLLKTKLNISSFGKDLTDELYVIDFNGAVYEFDKIAM